MYTSYRKWLKYSMTIAYTCMLYIRLFVRNSKITIGWWTSNRIRIPIKYNMKNVITKFFSSSFAYERIVLFFHQIQRIKYSITYNNEHFSNMDTPLYSTPSGFPKRILLVLALSIMKTSLFWMWTLFFSVPTM